MRARSRTGSRPNPGSRPFQRLTRDEYARSVRELLGIGVDVEKYLPADTLSEGLDNMADTQAFSLDTEALAALDRPVLISLGTESPQHFARIAEVLLEALPGAEIATMEGAGHLPHLTHPHEYAALVASFASAAAAPR